jgi:hypothetical protein
LSIVQVETPQVDHNCEWGWRGGNAQHYSRQDSRKALPLRCS